MKANVCGVVVVIGGGFAGLMTALFLSSSKPSPKIILIDPRSRFVFSPLLYELLSDELQLWEVAPTYRSLLVGKGISFVQDLAVNIDFSNKSVLTSAGEAIQYDQLVICSGAKPNTYGIPGVAENAFQFSRLEDVANLKALIDQFNISNGSDEAIVIAGAGPSGIELACKIADLLHSQTQIHLIEMGERVLPNGKSFNQEQAMSALKKRKINLQLETKLLKVTPDILELEHNSETSFLPYKRLIWTAGSKSSCPAGLPKNIFHKNSIAINSHFEVIGMKNVFAIGDVAVDINNPIGGTAQVAMQQAELLCKNLIAIRKSEPLQNFRFIDRGEMLSLGIGEATITASGLTLAGPIAFQLRRLIYLSRMPSLSIGIRSAGAWLIDHGKHFIN